MNNTKDLIKALLSRKFAIAFFGIVALCYVARSQPVELPVGVVGVEQFLAEPADPNIIRLLDEEAPIKAKQFDRISFYITAIVFFTVGVQGCLDYFKQRDADAIKLHSDQPEPEEVLAPKIYREKFDLKCPHCGQTGKGEIHNPAFDEWYYQCVCGTHWHPELLESEPKENQ